MSDTHNKTGTSATPPEDTANSLARRCPDLAEWPFTWRIEEDDVAVGRRILETFKPFLQNLLSRELADRTFARHRDNLWMLGGELIRRRYENPDLCGQPVTTALSDLVDADGGPLLWPRISESGQKSFDATCRKLYRFLRRSRNS